VRIVPRASHATSTWPSGPTATSTERMRPSVSWIGELKLPSARRMLTNTRSLLVPRSANHATAASPRVLAETDVLSRRNGASAIVLAEPKEPVVRPKRTWILVRGVSGGPTWTWKAPSVRVLP
jgi:hypothetical protein